MEIRKSGCNTYRLKGELETYEEVVNIPPPPMPEVWFFLETSDVAKSATYLL